MSILKLKLLPVFALICMLGAGTTSAQVLPDDFDFFRLAHPEIAEFLELTDQQRVEITGLVSAAAEATAAATPETRGAVTLDFQNRIQAIINAEQRQRLLQLPELRKLRFNFSSPKWEDVLRWFARQSDLSLVMGNVPSGDFNYSDNREYTPAQAIDLLNSILLTKGFTLVRRDKLLILVEIKDGIPDEIVPRVSMTELEKRGIYEIVTVMFSLGDKPVEAVQAEIRPVLGSYGKMALLPNSRQLLVTETVGKLRAISLLIESVPSPQKPPERQEKPKEPSEVRSYPLGKLEPTATITALNQLAPGAIISSDTTTGRIVVYGPISQLDLVKAYLGQLDISPDEVPDAPRVQTYELQGKFGEQQLLEQLAIAVPQAKFSFDVTNGRLVALATTGQHRSIRDTLRQLGLVSATTTGQSVQVFALRRANPTVVTEIVTAVSPRAAVRADATTSTVVVRAEEAELAIIRQLIEQLESSSSRVEDQLTLRSFPLERMPPTDFITALQGLVPQSKLQTDNKNRTLLFVGMPDDLVRVEAALQKLASEQTPLATSQLIQYDLTPAQIKVVENLWQQSDSTDGPLPRLADSDADRFVAWVTPEQRKQLDELVEQVKLLELSETDKQIKLYNLRGANQTVALELLRLQVPQAQITPDATGQSLTVIADPQHQAKVASIIERLMQETQSLNETTVEFYSLDARWSTSATTMLAQLVPTAKATWDTATNQFTVIASPEDHRRVADLLEKLRGNLSRPQIPRLVVYSLATDLRPRFTAILAAYSVELPGVQVIADQRPGELAILASEVEHEIVAQIVEQISQPVAGAEAYVIASYPTGTADAEKIVEFLRTVFTDVQMAIDEPGSRLLIWAPPAVQEKIKSTIQELGVEPTDNRGARTLRSYRLQTDRAVTILPLLQKFVPRMQLSAGDSQSLLVAWGFEQDHELLKQVVAQINAPDEPRSMAVEFYDTGELAPQQASLMLTKLFPDVTVVPHTSGSLLTVLARNEQHAMIRNAIDRLTSTATGEGPPTVAVYRVERTGNVAAVAALRGLVPEAQVFPGTTVSQVLALATATGHQRIQELVRILETDMPDLAGLTLKTYQLRQDLAAQVRPVLQAALPTLKMLGTDPNFFAVWARDDEHERLRDMIANAEQQLETSAKSYRSYSLEGLTPAQARSALLSQIPTLAFVELSDDRSLTALATAGEHERTAMILQDLLAAVPEPSETVIQTYLLPETSLTLMVESLPENVKRQATIRPDTESQSLIVTANPALHEQLATLIPDLANKLPKLERPYAKIYPLGAISARDWQALVTQIAPTASVAVDVNSGSLVITAKSEIHERMAQLVDELRTSITESKSVRVFRVSRADLKSASTALAALLPNCQITPDTTISSLMIVGSEADLDVARTTIEQIDLHAPNAAVSQVYPVPSGDAATLLTALRTLVPSGAFVADPSGKAILVLATDEEQATISSTISQWASDPNRALSSRVYQLQAVDPQSVLTVIRTLVPGATVAVDVNTQTLAATATAPQHELIAQAVAELDQTVAAPISKVYPALGVPAREWQTVIKQMAPNALVVADPNSNSLLVTAPEKTHQLLAQLEQEFRQFNSENKLVRSYPLLNIDVQAAAESLSALLPDSKVTPDKTAKALIVMASEKDHQRAEETIAQIDRRDGDVELRSYSTAEIPAESMARALRELFRNDPQVNVVAERDSRSLIAVARPVQHEMIAAMINDAERQAAAPDRLKTLRTWPVTRSDGRTLADSLNRLFEKEKLPPQISFDLGGKRLLALATPEQHEVIDRTVQQLSSEEQQFRVFRIQVIEPAVAMTALNNYFQDEPISSAPAMDMDYDSQSLMVRATDLQMTQIQNVLQQLGEPNFEMDSQTNLGENVRVLSGSRNWEAALEQIRQIWPQMSPNKLRIVQPNDATPSDTQPQQGTGTADEPAEIVVIAQPDRLLLASADTAALEQLQNLLNLIVRSSGTGDSRSPQSGTRNFDIFPLKNAGAEAVATQLKQMFRELATTRRTAGTAVGGVTPVVFAADDRLNMLIVHGSRADREVVGELLKILDSADVPNAVLLNQPIIVPVRNTQASRILTILNSLYRTQLSSGGGRKQISIPEGISQDVATVLQQVNAATAGPVLTLGVDEITNSVIVMAPQQLRDQVQEVIEQLDLAVETQPGEGIEIIKFENSSPERIQKALDMLLNRRPSGRR
ncbi:MAG: hypothetical protein KF851_10690 [Pirellulaceae bacterium]|nr:hypothetical protein [Pirellulaceae bacterium]